MITKLEINGIHAEVDKKLHDFVVKKIGKLDRYMSRQVRESIHAEVFLKEKKIKARTECLCEVVLHLPKETLTVKDASKNMFEAVDIVESKLRNLLKKYKDTHHSAGLHRRLYAKFQRNQDY